MNQANAIGETPLHIALRQDHYECALFLITRGSKLDIANNQGQLPADCLDEDKSRAAGLIQLGTTIQKLMSNRKARFLTEKTVSSDISSGKETIPITAINGEDLENGPSGYVYVKNNVITNPLPIDRNIANLQHCKCKDNCSNEETCRCSDISTRSWYDSNSVLKEGFDFEDPPMLFECNDMCSCNVNTCNNRVVQHGITARMQVYKTYGMGWGVKSLVDIPKGGFVCEYVGEIISDAEAEQRENDSYLFDLENRDGDTFCIDANKFGNVTRFINHSCDPNLTPVKVFTSHQDLRFPHIAMFASRDIKKGDVLGFDYGEKFWVIKHKFFTCWCGLEKCKYSKTAIGRTLDNYYKKNKDQLQSPEEKKQTGKLKLKLKMEEGKVVEVDDSQLLPNDPERRSSIEKERSKKLHNGSHLKDELISSDSDTASRKSVKLGKKSKQEKAEQNEKAISSLKEKISEIQGQIQLIENKKSSKSKEASIEPVDEIVNNPKEDPEEQVVERPRSQSTELQDELAEEFVEEVLREVADQVTMAQTKKENVMEEEKTPEQINENKPDEKSSQIVVEKKLSDAETNGQTLENKFEDKPEIKSEAKPEVKANQCPKCLTIINKPVKLKKHSRLCKGKSLKSSPAIDKTVDVVKTEKQIISKVVEEDLKNGNVVNVKESIIVENGENEQKRLTRQKKPMVDVNNILEKIPPGIKRSSSTSLRSSTSSTQAADGTKNTEADTQESLGSGRPKRSRKTVDKDL